MKSIINSFIEAKEIAVVGVSPKKGNWGQVLMKELQKKGITVFPINPNYEEVEGVKCLPSLSELPSSTEHLIMAVNPERARDIISSYKGSSIRNIWLNQGVGQGAYSPEAIDQMKMKNINYVYGFCPMMFFGGGMHKFHGWFRKSFGKTPHEFSKN